ncbi:MULTISPECIES: NAD(P)/FAD-dependent oxidoreductase [Pseudoalteromonas]|uniref:NAD(P)/FAD-dependent oxidoreductase n=1 Tax=Pseudoalteromonas TaxID=53246 RepID=UPI00110BFE9E|nr:MULTISPECIES: NAD(P)/FAD-dependent oxidoreductase [Pseudoalteromonas]TMP55916.1 thioredoxin reductase [Pseudoalteromonas sp. S1612]
METEVVIIGGSFAGLAAAMQLVRGRRKVVVIDAGKPRNRFASHSHGIFCLDGKSPQEIKTTALSQLQQYPTFTFLEAQVINVEDNAQNGFLVRMTEKSIVAKKLILASGVQDELPNIPGLLKYWGKSVIHCPYCHGYELSNRELGVLSSHPLSAHQAAMIPDWGPTTLFTQGNFMPDDKQLALLTKRGVKIENIPITHINGDGKNITSVALSDGSERAMQGLYVAPKISANNPIVKALNCELEESPQGEIIKVNEFKQTSVNNVYAAGDMSNPMQNGTLAITSGVMAGISVHQSLMFD